MLTEKRWRKHGWHKASEAQAHVGEDGTLPGVADEKDRQRSVDTEGRHTEDLDKEKDGSN